MLPEIELDVLCFFDRTTLEALQMYSRYLRDLVNRQARTLPLRQIGSVQASAPSFFMITGGKASMTLSPGVEDLETVFRRVDNAFIQELELTFCRENLPLLHYLRANANKLQCQVGTLSVRSTDTDIDYALVDFLGLHLKPVICKTLLYEFREDYAMLFARDALRGSVKELVFELEDDPTPDCIIPALFGVDVVETCTILTGADPRVWIRKFIETFERAKRGTDVVGSVTLHLSRFEAEPLHDVGDPLGYPQRTVVPKPRSDFIDSWYGEWRRVGYIITESNVAELLAFESAKLAKKLEVFAWSVKEQQCELYRLNYVFLLRVVDL